MAHLDKDPREPVEGLEDDELQPPQTKEEEKKNIDYNNLEGSDNDQADDLEGK
jgi:hypothetical protein